MASALAVRSNLHRGFVEPQVGDVKLLVKIARMPGKTELNGKAFEALLAAFRPGSCRDQIVEAQQLAAAPNAGGAVDRQLVFAAQPVAAFLSVQAGDQLAFLAMDLDLGQFPGFAFPQAKAWTILQQYRMVFGRRGDVFPRHVGNDRSLGIRRQIEAAI